MFIDYRLSKSWCQESQRSMASVLDEETARYDIALGDVVFRSADGGKLAADWGWVPLVDFAASMAYIVSDLSRPEVSEGVFEFTESNAKIFFRKSGKELQITATYSPDQIVVSFVVFRDAVGDFIDRLRKELLAILPSLGQSEAFQRLLSPLNAIS